MQHEPNRPWDFCIRIALLAEYHLATTYYRFRFSLVSEIDQRGDEIGDGQASGAECGPCFSGSHGGGFHDVTRRRGPLLRRAGESYIAQRHVVS
jgi:hypothetical protein